MISLDIKVEGVEKLVTALNNVAVMREPAAQAIELYLQKVVMDAKAIVPVRTGTLQRSIMFWGGKGEYHVGSRVHYAPYVEYGTSKMAPQAFLGPSLLWNIPTLRQALIDLVMKWLRERGE